MEGIDPPRGFAFAWFKIGNADIGVYSLHLKSISCTAMRLKRQRTSENEKSQFNNCPSHLHDMIGTTIPSIKGLIIGGDFGLRVGYRHLRTNDLDC
jgi:hypothetical protein